MLYKHVRSIGYNLKKKKSRKTHMQSGTVDLDVFKSSFLSVHYVAGMALNRLGVFLPRVGENNLSNIVF